MSDTKTNAIFSDEYYFDKYKEENEIFSSFDYDFIKIKYGALIDYKDFVKIHKNEIENYDNETLIKIYQIAYEGFQWSLKNNMPNFEIEHNSLLDNILNIKKEILSNEKEIYDKSFELNTNDFLLFLRKKINNEEETNYLFLSESLNESLNSKNSTNKSDKRILELNNRVEYLRNKNEEILSSNFNKKFIKYFIKYYQIHKEKNLFVLLIPSL